MNKRPLIVISNDDGVHAKGIRTLIDIAKKHGEIIAVAPDTEQSGKSHAMTVADPMKLKLVSEEPGVRFFSCNGTPVDCSKMAMKAIAERTPDLVISGINHGTNVGTNVFYSGTVGIAIDAAIEGIPSIGFSLCSYTADADFSETEEYIDCILGKVLDNISSLPKGLCLTVNIPYKPEGGIKGMKVCSLSQGKWYEVYEKRMRPGVNLPYYWITGFYEEKDIKSNSEMKVLADGYVSIVPLKIDITFDEHKKMLGSLLGVDVL